MILLKKCLLAFFGLLRRRLIAAGVYAFLAIIGVFVRPLWERPVQGSIFFCMRQ